MIDERSYVSGIMKATTELKAYTVEFWVRPVSSVSGTAYYLAI